MILRGLHVKLALIVAAGALVLAGLSSWWFYSRSYQDSINDSERSVKQLLATVEVSASIAAYVGNTELAQQVAAARRGRAEDQPQPALGRQRAHERVSGRDS